MRMIDTNCVKCGKRIDSCPNYANYRDDERSSALNIYVPCMRK